MVWITTEDGTPIVTEDSGQILVAEKPPAGPTQPLGIVIPAYPYQQYADDNNVVAFFTAYNELAQTYLDWFNQNSLAVYTLPGINGPLLDWIGQGIYGIKRPVFSSLTTQVIAGLNSRPLNTAAINSNTFLQSGTATIADDDFYKRVLTWFTYLGTSRRFSVQWLRWAVARFIYGQNGGDATINQAQTIHILSGFLNAPGAPALSYNTGGTIGLTPYGARVSYVTPIGETLAGPSSSLEVPANNLLVVASPPPAAGATGYNVYAAETTGLPAQVTAGINSRALNTQPLNGTNAFAVDWQKQNIAPIAIGTNWIEPTTGLISGGSPPTSNTSNDDTNLIITVPDGTAAIYFQDAFEQGLLAFPFQLTGSVVIA